ncbi:hypothetical protein M5X06_12940 [Paenibacillus alvei]|uniref:Uncharacterized protein n=2 Tax=Paenibacillus alvei TaxID=44250 RepID=A0ABT4EGW3_PAEAL|nr:hypothetical protein [Paenibacillus alvei]MCY9532980.1 hypothetical protein [Paenibacillus alvei]MCY9760427.1 hypothetical protein [Paenibacillus alvei]MCY9767719.1 hypothetical protein [Paenibacillus alvei]
MRNLFTRSNRNTLKIGDKTVHPRRIAIAKWRELFDSIQLIPQLLMSVITAAPQDRAGYFVVALRESFDDIVRVTSILTGIDEEYIEENASIDQLIAFYKATADANNFGELLKNGRSVLGAIVPNLTAETTSQDAN